MSAIFRTLVPERLATPIRTIATPVPGFAYFVAPPFPVPDLRPMTALDTMYAYYGADLA